MQLKQNIHTPFELLGHLTIVLVISIAAVPALYFFYTITSLITDIPAFIKYPLLGIIGVLSYYIFGITLMLSTTLFKIILISKSKEEGVDLKSRKGYSFILLHGLFHITTTLFLSLIRGSYLLNIYYKFFGLKVGDNAILNSLRISDFDLITLGDNCVIGYDAVINGHSVVGNRLLKKKVKVGNNVTIGQYAIISPGVTIEDNVIVGANSFVPIDMVLKKNSTYIGSPVRKLNQDNHEIIVSSSEIVSKIESKTLNRSKILGIETSINIMLKDYELRNNEISSIENRIANLYVSSFGILSTIIIYSIINAQPKLISIIPPMVVFIYIYLVSSATSMLKISVYMCRMERTVKDFGHEFFNWESTEGIMGDARGLDFDNQLISVFYLLCYISCLALTTFGNIFTEKDVYFGYTVKSLLVSFNIAILVWALTSLGYFFYKKRQANCNLNF